MLKNIIQLFNDCFYSAYNTRLISGESEPVYYPANVDCGFHRIVFANGFFSSALHEVSHWCIAGKQRRLELDYGYWYVADGRNLSQQTLFQAVEVKPQALEWIFSKAAGIKFNISADNLDGEHSDTIFFKEAVYQQVTLYCQQGLGSRAQLFHDQIAKNFNPGYQLSMNNFLFSEL